MENNMKEWTTLRILYWITLFVIIIGKNSIMEQIRESKLSVAMLMVKEYMNALNMRGMS